MALRRFGDRVLIIPDFTAMIQGDWEATEYAPPRWMEQKGPLSFSPSDWDVFRTTCTGAPCYETIAPASTSEVLRLYHFLTPRAFLPDWRSPSLAKWELILCTNGHDSDKDLMHLRQLFSDPRTFARHEFCTPQPDSYTVSAFLDLLSIAEWRIFSSEPVPSIRLSDDIHFRLQPKV